MRYTVQFNPTTNMFIAYSEELKLTFESLYEDKIDIIMNGLIFLIDQLKINKEDINEFT